MRHDDDVRRRHDMPGRSKSTLQDRCLTNIILQILAPRDAQDT
jgi:hypothetical protein